MLLKEFTILKGQITDEIQCHLMRRSSHGKKVFTTVRAWWWILNELLLLRKWSFGAVVACCPETSAQSLASVAKTQCLFGAVRKEWIREFNHVTPQLGILYAFLVMPSQEEYGRTRLIYLLDDLHHSFVLNIINVRILGRLLLPLCRRKLSPPSVSLLEKRKPPHLASQLQGLGMFMLSRQVKLEVKSTACLDVLVR